MDTHDWDSITIERSILEQVSCQVIPLEFSSDDGLIAAIRDADALLPRYVNIQRHHIEAMKNCKIIARSGIGVDIVDVGAATEHGIWVTNVPNYCAEEVADHALALILACTRKLHIYHQGVRSGQWKWQTGVAVPRLSQATFGLIGFGKIGRLIWQRMKAFGCRGLVYDPYLPPEAITSLNAIPTSLEELLRSADIVHIQSPLTPETHHLIGARQLGMMKPGAILVNTARGPIIDEQALIKALKEHWIFGAGLDVYEHEPEISKELRQLDNVVLQPHIASGTIETRTKMAVMAAENMIAGLKGKIPPNCVNPEVFKRSSIR